MNQDWQIGRQIELARENYVGTIEYCCWAPDQVYDLTPDTEQFEPHTELQAAYTASLTRSFLQALIRRAHDNGLRVLAMGTGMASLQGAREHPEQMMYTPDGQMYLHSGALHDGRRHNAVGAHVFTPERITAWANEMAASVDMFGWDGVRFDWNFFPLSQATPRPGTTRRGMTGRAARRGTCSPTRMRSPRSCVGSGATPSRSGTRVSSTTAA